MKKYFFLFLLLTISCPLFGQLDLEHWFPPVYRSVTFYGSSNLEINISTPHINPFRVYIYSRGTLQKTITISKNNPGKYSFLGKDFIASGLNYLKTQDTGIHLVGENSFYADLRFYQGGNCEMIYSKGKSALGTDFMSVNTSIDMYEGFGSLTLMTSVMATQDNTTIKFYGYDPKITFIDGTKSNTREITLNKGESYVFVAKKADNFDIYDNEYFNTLNGAKIQSSKPIVVVSGGFNTQYAYENGNGSTILEQLVPIKNLGKEFFMKSGFSSISKHTEKAFIVATKDNTKLYFNNTITPQITLNAGQYYLTPINLFIGKSMYIKSSEPIYCMQLSSGTNKAGRAADYSYFAGSMSYLHPLDKTLPGKIDKIINTGKIGEQNYRNFLNLLVPKGNSLKINNQFPNPASGPFPITGNEDYMYYSLEDHIGDVEIESENGLIATIIGGSSEYVHGWSSATTGFSNDPYILKSGNCIEEEVELKVSNVDFERFQWQKNKINIDGAENSTYYPTTSGYYRCILTYSGVTYATEEVYVDYCPYLVTEKDLGNICSKIIGEIKFSAPNENKIIDRIKILTPPTNGKVTINNLNKTYNYEANTNYTGTDRFVLEICTTNSSLCEALKLKVNVLQTPNENFSETLTALSTDDNFSIYDLSLARININSSNNVTYYKNQDLTEEIVNYEKYETNEAMAYAKITSPTTSCSGIKKIKLIPLPIIADADLVLPNFLSPNADSMNDILDFSILKSMLNVKVVISDRYGKKVFESNGENFIWNGRNIENKPLPTNAYWAIFTWTSPTTKLTTTKKQWIMLKNN
ncbi:gliding motility-associated C-terminal domain-containing protein [Soonwooa sp.]|uniref:T9SS type B sorting domain-containing protein n=1 Tax=Soonwooa sp. TaxID=1938592 RepID=UPI0028AF1905|nr:gliding motility-associated C-terminal domain-containing protein [Soonwooa sp.]